jgi:hypothetical protein
VIQIIAWSNLSTELFKMRILYLWWALKSHHNRIKKCLNTIIIPTLRTQKIWVIFRSLISKRPSSCLAEWEWRNFWHTIIRSKEEIPIVIMCRHRYKCTVIRMCFMRVTMINICRQRPLSLIIGPKLLKIHSMKLKDSLHLR